MAARREVGGSRREAHEARLSGAALGCTTPATRANRDLSLTAGRCRIQVGNRSGAGRFSPNLPEPGEGRFGGFDKQLVVLASLVQGCLREVDRCRRSFIAIST